MTIIRSLAMC